MLRRMLSRSLLLGLGCLLMSSAAGAQERPKPAFVFTGIPDQDESLSLIHI